MHGEFEVADKTDFSHLHSTFVGDNFDRYLVKMSLLLPSLPLLSQYFFYFLIVFSQDFHLL